MEFRQIQYFIKVAEKLNFTQAARELFVSQSALSQQIAALENELGVTLLKRSKQKVSLTSQGTFFYEKCKQSVNLLEETVVQLKSMDDPNEENTLRIGLNIKDADSVLAYGVSDAIFHNLSGFLDINIKISYIELEEVNDVMINKDIDIVLCILSPQEFDLIKFDKKVLAIDEVNLYTHKNIFGTPRELLEKYPILQMENDFMIENIVRKLAKEIYRDYKIQYINSVAESKDILNVGYGIVPSLTKLASEENNFRMLDLGDLNVDRRVFITAIYQKVQSKKGDLIQAILSELS